MLDGSLCVFSESDYDRSQCDSSDQAVRFVVSRTRLIFVRLIARVLCVRMHGYRARLIDPPSNYNFLAHLSGARNEKANELCVLDAGGCSLFLNCLFVLNGMNGACMLFWLMELNWISMCVVCVNVPLPPFFRPERNVDVVFAFDARFDAHKSMEVCSHVDVHVRACVIDPLKLQMKRSPNMTPK